MPSLSFRIGAVVLSCAFASAAIAKPVIFAPQHAEPVIVDREAAPLMKSAGPGFKQLKVNTGITFNITYRDVVLNNNIGFDDPSLGAARRATLEAVLTEVDSFLNYPSGTLDLVVDASQNDGTNFLAAAGRYFPLADGFFSGSTIQRLETGSKPFPGTEEMTLTVDFGYTWNSDMDSPGGSEYDLYSVLLHEFTHALGFVTLLDSDGTSKFSDDPDFPSDTFTAVDQLLMRSSNSALILGGNPPAFIGGIGVLTGGANALNFSGTHAVATYGSNPPIHTPNLFTSGSSIGHWQGGSFGNTQQDGIDAVMVPTIGAGVERRDWRAFEIEMLKDLGLDVQVTSSVGNWQLY